MKSDRALLTRFVRVAFVASVHQKRIRHYFRICATSPLLATCLAATSASVCRIRTSFRCPRQNIDSLHPLCSNSSIVAYPRQDIVSLHWSLATPKSHVLTVASGFLSGQHSVVTVAVFQAQRLDRARCEWHLQCPSFSTAAFELNCHSHSLSPSV